MDNNESNKLKKYFDDGIGIIITKPGNKSSLQSATESIKQNSHSFEDGYLEIRKENGIVVNGSAIQYDPKIRWEKQQKQDSSYLEDASNFIKQNYKCPKGTIDDSNKCEPEGQNIAKENIPIKTTKLDAIERFASKTLNKSIENSVNFDGFSESRASKIADHLNIIKERAQIMRVPMFERVGTRNIPKMQMATMHGVVGLNPKEIDSIIKERKEGKQTGTITDYFKSEDKIISLLLDHEFGHQILENMDPDLQSITHAKFDPNTPKPVEHMNQNSDEWFADNYALYVNGKKSLVDKQLKLLFSVIVPEKQRKQDSKYLEDVVDTIKQNKIK